MMYRGIRYSLRQGIAPAEWVVAVHPQEDESIEKIHRGSRIGAELRARSMIDAWLKSHAAQEPKNSN